MWRALRRGYFCQAVHDATTLIWEWSLADGQVGTLTNRAYPAATHPATDCVMDVLLDLEDKYIEDEA